MGHLLLAGVTLGLTAGFSPGPLSVFIVAVAVRHGRRAVGLCFVPLLADVPLLIVTLLVFSRVQFLNSLVPYLMIVGGIFLVYLGYGDFVDHTSLTISPDKEGSFGKAMLINVLNPYPYLFYFTVVGPLIGGVAVLSPQQLIFFLIPFYSLLVGAKLFLVGLVCHARGALASRRYEFLLKGLAALLMGYGVYFVYRGLGQLL